MYPTGTIDQGFKAKSADPIDTLRSLLVMKKCSYEIMVAPFPFPCLRFRFYGVVQ